MPIDQSFFNAESSDDWQIWRAFLRRPKNFALAQLHGRKFGKPTAYGYFRPFRTRRKIFLTGRLQKANFLVMKCTVDSVKKTTRQTQNDAPTVHFPHGRGFVALKIPHSTDFTSKKFASEPASLFLPVSSRRRGIFLTGRFITGIFFSSRPHPPPTRLGKKKGLRILAPIYVKFFGPQTPRELAQVAGIASQ